MEVGLGLGVGVVVAVAEPDMGLSSQAVVVYSVM